MNSRCLRSPEESVSHLARVFDAGDNVAFLEVHEDICFQKNAWLRIGRVTVYPAVEEQGDGDEPLEQAIRYGSYGWSLPAYKDMLDEVEKIYDKSKEAKEPKDPNETKKAAHKDRTRRALEAITECAVKCGFINPTFDARSVSSMPFVRPTTVVVDTSAAKQGGLDFVIRFLYPMARIKIPAIVHMEILVMADRYFSRRRSPKKVTNLSGALLDHVSSQGAQRVLLRIELHTEAEIERPRLGADPLRGVVQHDTDAEDSALNLQVIQRSFADRLILETAIQHRDRLSPDHPIMVLTADQGLARMTLGEGLRPLFFSTPTLESICGRTLSGTVFRPFIDNLNDASLFQIPLPTLLWELAITFGSARLVTADKLAAMTVSAIGEELSWHPYHSHDDLLWSWLTFPPAPTQPIPGEPLPEDQPIEDLPAAEPFAGSIPECHQDPIPGEHQVPDAPDARAKEQFEVPVDSNTPEEKNSKTKPQSALTGSYRFPPNSMLTLAFAMARKGWISDIEGSRIVSQKTIKRYQDFRNFFLSGQFAKRERDGLRKLPALDDLVDAVKLLDLVSLKELFSRVSSFTIFLDELSVGRPLLPSEIKNIGKAAVSTYVGLSEICCAALDIPDEGIYLTPKSPPPSEFAALALDVYKKLKGGEQYVLTGKWLEVLAKTHGIHPINTRVRLNEARAAGLIERYTEGSTPETQFERHNMLILEVSNGQPHTKRLNLYHGNFIIPDKASVSIRLEDRTHGPA